MEICHLNGGFTKTPLQYRFNRSITLLKTLKSSSLQPKFSCKLEMKISRDEKESLTNSSAMLILGMGFVGRFVGKQLQKENWKVFGTCTNSSKKKELEMMGFDVEIFSANDNGLGSLDRLEHATHLLVSIPPIVGLGDPVLCHDHNLLWSRLRDGKLRWICYLSSTSVYGDSGGSWVDEDYPPNPTTESAKARLAAEEAWLNVGHDLGISVQVFRLGGIYGPGRSAIDTIMKQGSLTETQRWREARKYTSRVHVADIYQAIKACIQTPSSGRIYNIVDDEPAPRAEVFAFARTLVEKNWPNNNKINPTSTPKISSSSTSDTEGKTGQGEKRVSNSRLKNELGVNLLHSSYKSGLEDIADFISNSSQ